MTSTSECMFQQQIQSLMYAFGDAKQPDPASAVIVEDFTRKQTKELVKSATHLASMREGRIVLTQDVLFLLRKDKDQLKRALNFLELKEVAKKVTGSQSRGEDVELLEGMADYGDQAPAQKREKLTNNFLTPLQLAELRLEEVDQQEVQRLERQDALTSSMSASEYLDYTAAKGTSLCKKMGKFKEWLEVEETGSLRYSPDVFAVVGHLAREAVKKLVELSLQVKSDMSRKTLRRWPAIEGTLGQVPALSRLPTSSPAGPALPRSGPFVSPPPPHTPSVDNPLNGPDPLLTGTRDSSHPQPPTVRGTRKRQRSGASVTQDVDTPTQDTPTQPTTPQTTTAKRRTPQALKPVHVREAIRRLEQHHLSAPVNMLWTHHPTSQQPRSWCL